MYNAEAFQLVRLKTWSNSSAVAQHTRDWGSQVSEAFFTHHRHPPPLPPPHQVWDPQFFISPLGGIRPGEVTKHCIWVMPEVPQDPEPHGTTQQLCLEVLVLGELRKLPVLGLNVRSAASFSDDHFLRAPS
uniref:Uncharacterized protein n=1 Tax=Anguilla anguilla TaxID=7936 RepID=A0A0E9WIJ6_ANGAN